MWTAFYSFCGNLLDFSFVRALNTSLHGHMTLLPVQKFNKNCLDRLRERLTISFNLSLIKNYNDKNLFNKLLKMKLAIVLFSASISLVASQCLVNQPGGFEIELRNHCSYDQVLKRVKQARNGLRAAGDTTCARSVEEELQALLDLTDEVDMIAKIENICDEAISHSRNDQDFAVKFGDIQLIDSEDSTTINRFLKEYYDGGKLRKVYMMTLTRFSVNYDHSPQTLIAFL